MENVESAKFIALVLDGEVDIEARDNALYRVLTESLRPRLLRRFRAYEKIVPFAKVLSTVIAYCYQELPLVQRFVFLRMILTYLDRDRALPLNMNALEMRNRLDAVFSGWYDLLSFYYAETIAQFTQAEEINTLRYSYATDSSDMMLHDGD